MVAQKNRKIGKFRIEKIGKTGNFAVKKKEKNRKMKSTFVDKDSLPAPRKATSPQILCSQDLDQLSRLRRSENDQ